MHDFTAIVFDIELSLAVAFVTSFVLGFLLMLIKVPTTEYARKLAKSKNTIAVCFLICSVLFYYALAKNGEFDSDRFTSMMLLIINAFVSAVMSFSLIYLMDESYIDSDKFYLNIGVVAVVSIMLIHSYGWESGWLKTGIIIGSIVLFITQCIIHIIIFNKVYLESLEKLEQYYDEEEEHKIRWVRFIYIIMMLTQMFILVYLLLPSGLMKIYAAFYSLFMIYFTANFISFLGSHKLLLDAFAYRTLSGEFIARKPSKQHRNKKTKAVPDEGLDTNELEFHKIEKNIERWVLQKKFCEYDKNRDEIARSLNTTKEMLHVYFMMRVGKDFKTWRTELRIEEAKKLLIENPDVSINIIGEQAGFSDRANFHRQFVKIVGCSPKVYRENNK